MKPIHDYGYKKLFSNKTIFRQLIQTFVTEDWVKDLDFTACQIVNKTFISEEYKKTESDVIYKVGLHGRPVFIYILLEFQSTVDRWMAVRLMHYVSGFWLDYKETHKGVKKLPAVFPLVLYNGDRPWTAPTALTGLIDATPDLGQFAPRFNYFKIAENEFTPERLLAIRNVVSMLFLAETQDDPELLTRELVALYDRESDRQAISLLVNWFKQLAEHGRIAPADYQWMEHVYESKEEIMSMLAKRVQRERKALYQQGKNEGKVEGKTERNLEVAKRMLAEGFEVEVIVRVTGLAQDEVIQLMGD